MSSRSPEVVVPVESNKTNHQRHNTHFMVCNWFFIVLTKDLSRVMNRFLFFLVQLEIIA
jgi:hypothetical protein